MSRSVCIHAHFYQPPREDPWTGMVPIQPSAAPWHDWNERVTAECYAPNALARRLGGDGSIVEIVNNYASISFDFGPTLLRWLERERADVYAAVLEADEQSSIRFGGHGSAMAQAYGHPILPLATSRDLRTQVQWGVADFRQRFRRDPEGMWLPETAVDLATLEVLADNGILFTVLEPHQAALSPDQASVDPRFPYRLDLPSGNSIALFFYDGPTSRAVAFEDLLASGDRLADRLAAGFAGEGRQLVSIATDGETFGHHQKFGEMALAHALWRLSKDPAVQLTNYAEYLANNPPDQVVQLHERTSWSCVHGVERWRSDCGCSTGGRAGWNQAWRAPLRSALEWLAGELDVAFETGAATLVTDPWAARDDYLAAPEPEDRVVLLQAMAARALDPDDIERLELLLESQRYALLMFTSCGWFFNDLAGIETVQILRYAGRAAQLAWWAGAADPSDEFVRRLAQATSNRMRVGNGADLYRREVLLRAAPESAAILASQLAAEPHSPVRLQRLRRQLEAIAELPQRVDLWRAQNAFFGLLQRLAPIEPGAREGDLAAVARLLSMRLPD